MKMQLTFFDMQWHTTATVALITAILLSPPTRAAGLLAYEVGSADVCLASAGYGGRAQGPSTVFTNPAGMTRLLEESGRNQTYNKSATFLYIRPTCPETNRRCEI